MENADPNAEVHVTISKDSSKIDNFYMNWNNDMFNGRYTMQEAGNFKIKIESKVENKTIDTKLINIKVLDRVLEFTEIGQNRELLEFISNESKGEMIEFDQIDQIISSINSNSTVTYEDKELNFYIHKLIFGLLLILLSFEWITRKYFGHL